MLTCTSSSSANISCENSSSCCISRCCRSRSASAFTTPSSPSSSLFNTVCKYPYECVQAVRSMSWRQQKRRHFPDTDGNQCMQNHSLTMTVWHWMLKLNKALDKIPVLELSAIWDHTVLPATQHKWMRRAFPQPVSWYSVYLPQRDGKPSQRRLPGNAMRAWTMPISYPVNHHSSLLIHNAAEFVLNADKDWRPLQLPAQGENLRSCTVNHYNDTE